MSSADESDRTPQPADHAIARRVRLALLDDHEVLLDSLSSWINANATDFDLVLSAHTWLQLVHSDQFPTDLVFIDPVSTGYSRPVSGEGAKQFHGVKEDAEWAKQQVK